MPCRYLLEVRYLGTGYAGFQVQENAKTIQSEIEHAIATICRTKIELTGSSRTDAGVHAQQNFFHFDAKPESVEALNVYKLNALLPAQISAQSLASVSNDFHCRFQASSRVYHYHLHKKKNPFLAQTSWLYPYPLNYELLQQAAKIFLKHHDFSSFSKRNTQTKTMDCNIMHSEWSETPEGLVYAVEANRFLRGMVRALTGTMLWVGREKISLQQMEEIILAKDCTKANFASPPHGLTLMRVKY